jgi:hypothetical protein
MLANRWIAGWCLGVVAVSTGGAPAKPSGYRLTGVFTAALSSFESAASRSPPHPLVPVAMKVAQNTTGRHDSVANTPNTANVSLQMSPGQPVSVGTKISFRVTAKRPGYLLLVDIDANGTISQIFPSPEMIVQAPEAAANLIRPGEELLIPNTAAQNRGFQYLITPPAGEATIVAILSDRRVQIIDLPDNAEKLRTEAEIIRYLTGWTSELRVPDPATGKLQPSHWSFDIKHYTIRE